MSRNFKTQGCQWDGVKRIKFIFTDKENSKIRFGAPLSVLSSSHSINKTDREHNLLIAVSNSLAKDLQQSSKIAGTVFCVNK